jgi:hypothetical protein
LMLDFFECFSQFVWGLPLWKRRFAGLGVRGTAKEPYALEGTFRGWWMILVRSLERDCLWSPW